MESKAYIQPQAADPIEVGEEDLLLFNSKEASIMDIPLLPLRDVVIFPGMILPLFVGRPRSVAALEAAIQGTKRLTLVTQKRIELEDPKPTDLYSVGALAQVLQVMKLPDGSMKALVEGLRRVRILDVLAQDPFYVGKIELIRERREGGVRVKALERHARDQFEQYIKLNRRAPQETLLSIMNVDDPGRLADSIAANLGVGVSEKQRLLAAASPSTRLRYLSELLTNELEILEMETRIKSEVRKQMEQSQKEYYLQEQIKVLQRELGKDGESGEEWGKFHQRIKDAKMSAEAEKKAQEELERLKQMPSLSPEAAVVRNYLDWLCDLPWAKSTKDRLDILKAEKILNDDHYGLDKPKERILEFLAVRKLKPKMKGPILCFVGPPGVGKTSLGRSIARALGRKFVRLSLGGVRDEAEIRGHRRTYIGSMPGRIIQSLKKAGSRNPVFLLDEIDKMSMDFRGDPASALLEVLDPEQNNTFSDHYLEVEFDLSEVMFIATANVAHPIPPALHDRLEIIEIASYTEEEKAKIAKGFLWPKQVNEHGLKKYKPRILEKAILQTIRDYTHEAGVRNLNRELASICRKLAKQAASSDLAMSHSVTPQRVNDLLGVPRYRDAHHSRENGVGSATGLAVTRVGGETMATEVTLMPGTGQLILTGQLGDVMQESAKAALSFTRARARGLGLDPDFHKRFDLHVHAPEGAIPKDGPSAGITIASALISALTGRPVIDGLAMTGEITLRGKVLQVGGIKEKVLAAHRAGIRRVILPHDNRKDEPDIPALVLENMRIEYVQHMDEVLRIALAGE